VSSSFDAIGLDFGTTNSVVAAVDSSGASELVAFDGPSGPETVFRSALCFWLDEAADGKVAHEAGSWAIAEYLTDPEESRFIQSFKSVAASTIFEHASVFDKRYRFEDLGRLFLARMMARSKRPPAARPSRVAVGRPVKYAGARPHDAMVAGFADEVFYVYEPLAAAYSYASRRDDPATVLVADFGGGTSDFSVVRIAGRGAARRCEPLGYAGLGIAGDRFDYCILNRLVLPILGCGGLYRSFGKELEIPRGYFADFADWSRLALMRNHRTLRELARLQRAAVDPVPIGRMIAIVENELGYSLYEAVNRLKRSLSSEESANFQFSGGGVDIDAEVAREEFERWIAADVARVEQTIDQALAAAGLTAAAIDKVFLTGGTSLIPRIRRIFLDCFGEEAIEAGGELTSIAHGLALIANEGSPAAWAD
jgi:hypothetical chaperone protein